MNSRYVSNKLLIARVVSEEMIKGFWLVGLLIEIVAFIRQIVILDYLPLTTIKTLRMILIF